MQLNPQYMLTEVLWLIVQKASDRSGKHQQCKEWTVLMTEGLGAANARANHIGVPKASLEIYSQKRVFCTCVIWTRTLLELVSSHQVTCMAWFNWVTDQAGPPAVRPSKSTSFLRGHLEHKSRERFNAVIQTASCFTFRNDCHEERGD